MQRKSNRPLKSLQILISCCFILLFSEKVFSQETDSIQTPKKKSSYLNQQGNVKIFGFPLASYTPETSLALGAGAVLTMHHKNDTANTATFIAPFLTYSLKKFLLAEVFGSFFAKGKTHQLDFEGGYYKNNYPFFGIGNNHPTENKELFQHDVLRVQAVYQYRFKKNLLIGPRYYIENTTPQKYAENRQLDTIQPAGYEGGFIQGLGFRAGFDNRDDMYFPYKGNYAVGTVTAFPKFLGSNYQFVTLSADYRSFINIRRKVILASQIQAQIALGDVPFYQLPKMGGKMMLRGWPEGINRDHYLFSLQGELRVPFKRFVFSGFFGSATVGSEFMDYFKVKKYTYSMGGGLRYKIFAEKNIFARLDVGFWKGTYGVYVVFNEAF